MKSTLLELTITPSRIAWLKFVLESYEGLALLRTIDPVAGRVVLMIGPGAEEETAGLIRSLGPEVGLVPGLSDELPDET